MAIVSYIAFGYAIAGGVLTAAAIIAGFSAAFLLGFFRKHGGGHRHHHSHHGKFGGLLAAPAEAVEKLMDLHDSADAHGRALAGELAIVAFFLFFTLSALCSMTGSGSLLAFGLAPAVVQNIYPLFAVAMYVSGAIAAFCAVGAAGAAFPALQLVSIFTGAALFLHACTPSGNTEMWISTTIAAFIGMAMTGLVTAMAARQVMTPMSAVVVIWTMILGFVIWLFNFLAFSVNVIGAADDTGAYRWVFPGVLAIAGLGYIPLVFVAAASANTPGSADDAHRREA